ncbi:MAG TPA: FUSC family protein [Bryobacteraceae bacterium]
MRTTVAASVSLTIARLFRLPEAEWAAISTMVVTQSTLGAALSISGERFAGTALGAFAGGLLATYLRSGMLAFVVGLFALGLVCAVLRLDRAAYRFAGITLAVVVLIARGQPAVVIAIHRFFEVSLGIATGLAFTAIWPERERSE